MKFINSSAFLSTNAVQLLRNENQKRPHVRETCKQMCESLVEMAISLDAECDKEGTGGNVGVRINKYCSCLRALQLFCTLDAEFLKPYAPLILPLLSAEV